jgi:YVTN family beta-propeller protein
MRSAGFVIFFGAISAAHAAPTLYASCEDDGVLVAWTVSHGAHGVELSAPRRIDVGKRPRGLRVSPDGRALYVAVSGSPKRGPGGTDAVADRSADGIALVDPIAGRVTRVLESGSDPESFDLSPDGATIFVSNEETARASLVRVVDGRVLRTVSVGGEPEGVAVRPDGRAVYVTSENDGVVTVFDPAHARQIAAIKVPARPRSVVFDRTGARAYVSSENGAAISVIDARRHAVTATIAIPNDGVEGPLGARPMGLALTRDGRTLYVTNGRGGTVSVIDTTRDAVVRTLPRVGARPWGVALAPDEDALFTANGPSNDISIVDLRSGAVRQLPACAAPWGLVLAR